GARRTGPARRRLPRADATHATGVHRAGDVGAPARLTITCARPGAARSPQRSSRGRRSSGGGALSRALAIVVSAAALLVLPAAARADVITATCSSSGATAPCSSGWYRADVTVSFVLPAGSSNPQGCGNVTISSDTTAQTLTCTVTVSGSQCCRLDVTIKRDATPPAVSAIAAARGPDTNGWYNHAVGVTVTGTDATSGIAACSGPTYSGPDSSSATVNGTCVDNAGNV